MQYSGLSSTPIVVTLNNTKIRETQLSNSCKQSKQRLPNDYLTKSLVNPSCMIRERFISRLTDREQWRENTKLKLSPQTPIKNVWSFLLVRVCPHSGLPLSAITSFVRLWLDFEAPSCYRDHVACPTNELASTGSSINDFHAFLKANIILNAGGIDSSNSAQNYKN